jgi:CRISPR/Cas system CSM-associated protein Csm3 (group 7 of RAMP superfamily)
MMPLVSANGAGQEAPVIPGSSSKGALRQQSERILATVFQRSVADTEQGRERFIGQLARMALVETLYGAVKKKRKEEGPEAPNVDDGAKRPGRGALGVDDCLAVRSLPRADWQAIADVALVKDSATAEEKAGAIAVRARAAANSIDIATHVAIDRWTGGAADGALFTAAEPHLEWEPIRIEIDPTRLVPSDKEDKEKVADCETVAQAAIALLLLTLKDLAAGLVSLGFGVNRGYGDIEVRSVTVTVEGAPKEPWIGALVGLQFTKQNGCVEIGPKDKLAPLARAWTDYLAAHLSDAGESAETQS